MLALAGTFNQLLTYVGFSGWIFYGLAAVPSWFIESAFQTLIGLYNVPGYPWTPLLFIVAACLLVANTLFNNLRDQPKKTAGRSLSSRGSPGTTSCGARAAQSLIA